MAIEWIITLLASTGAAAFFSWLFKEALGKALDRALQRDVDRYKTELQLQSQNQIERLKADLQLQAQQQLEQLRSELNARNDVIRHELQKQMLRAQLTANKAHEVYSELVKKIRMAEGRVGDLWGARFGVDLSGYSLENFQKVLAEARPGGEEEKEILGLLKIDRAAGIKRVQSVLNRRRIEDARDAVSASRNMAVLDGIFMTNPVRELAFDVCKHLWNATVNADMLQQGFNDPEIGQGYKTSMDASAQGIESLENAMRADLLPALVEPSRVTPTAPSRALPGCPIQDIGRRRAPGACASTRRGTAWEVAEFRGVSGALQPSRRWAGTRSRTTTPLVPVDRGS